MTYFSVNADIVMVSVSVTKGSFDEPESAGITCSNQDRHIIRYQMIKVENYKEKADWCV